VQAQFHHIDYVRQIRIHKNKLVFEFLAHNGRLKIYFIDLTIGTLKFIIKTRVKFVTHIHAWIFCISKGIQYQNLKTALPDSLTWVIEIRFRRAIPL